MVDRELVLRKLAELELYLRQVSEFRKITVEQYARDWKAQRIIERTLQMAIEVCADVANHVISDRRLKIPSTYAEAFEILAQAELLDARLRTAMVRMTGFRNVLVHEYASVDPEIVVGILRDHLVDLQRYAAAAAKWV